jgi:hypothetical protein
MYAILINGYDFNIRFPLYTKHKEGGNVMFSLVKLATAAVNAVKAVVSAVDTYVVGPVVNAVVAAATVVDTYVVTPIANVVTTVFALVDDVVIEPFIKPVIGEISHIVSAVWDGAAKLVGGGVDVVHNIVDNTEDAVEQIVNNEVKVIEAISDSVHDVITTVSDKKTDFILDWLGDSESTPEVAVYAADNDALQFDAYAYDADAFALPAPADTSVAYGDMQLVGVELTADLG